MANFEHGQDFSDNNISAQRLIDLVEEARFTEMTESALYSGLGMMGITTEGSPYQGHIYNTGNADKALRYYDGSAYLSLGNLYQSIQLTNKSGSALVTGDVVVASTTTDWAVEISSNPNVEGRVIGVAATNIADNAAGAFFVRGGPVTTLVRASSFGKPAGSWLAGPTTGTTSALVDDDPTDAPNTFGATAFGWLMQAATGTTLAECFLWR